MTVDEARFEIKRLPVKQKQLEREILSILNNGCLPLDEAKEKMKTLGIETEIRGGVQRVVITTTKGKREYTSFPLWYPLYATMDDVFASLEIDKAMIKDIKKRQSERLEYERGWGIKGMDDGRYVADREKVFGKIEEYLDNKAKIEELTKVLEDTMTADDIQEKINFTLAMLVEGFFIKKVNNEHQALKDLPDIQAELKVKKLMEKIDYPESDRIDDFILRYIKNREGKSFSNAFRQERHRQKKK
jgi:hypothetical protein